jgi:hypothetical protein
MVFYSHRIALKLSTSWRMNPFSQKSVMLTIQKEGSCVRLHELGTLPAAGIIAYKMHYLCAWQVKQAPAQSLRLSIGRNARALNGFA